MIGYKFSKTYIQNTNPAYSGILVTYTEITWNSVKPQCHYFHRFVSRQNNINCIMCSLKTDQLILHVTMFCGTNSERRHKMWETLLDTVKTKTFNYSLSCPQIYSYCRCLLVFLLWLGRQRLVHAFKTILNFFATIRI